MNLNLEPQSAITPEKALRLLDKQGVKICPENAAEVVAFLYILAEVFYNQHNEQ